MEKFTKWADKGTGINPFLPQRRAASSLPSKVASGLLAIVLIAVRLPLILLTLTWFFALSLLTKPWFDILTGALFTTYAYLDEGPSKPMTLSPQHTGFFLLVLGSLTALSVPIRRVFSFLTLRPPVYLLLSILGVSYREQHANLRKLGLRPPGHRPHDSRIGRTIQAGDILLSNHTSPLEVLFFISRFLPAFSALAVAPVAQGRLLTPLQAWWRAGLVPPKAFETGTGQALSSLAAEAKRQGQAVVVFPETARSNGDGVLVFQRGVLDGTDAKEAKGGKLTGGERGGGVNVHIFGFSAPKGEIMPTHTVGSVFGFYLQLLSRWRTTVNVSYVGAPELLLQPTSAKGSGGGSRTPVYSSEELRSLLANMLGRPKLNLGYEDFCSFRKYYAAIRAGDEERAAALARAREKM